MPTPNEVILQQQLGDSYSSPVPTQEAVDQAISQITSTQSPSSGGQLVNAGIDLTGIVDTLGGIFSGFTNFFGNMFPGNVTDQVTQPISNIGDMFGGLFGGSGSSTGGTLSGMNTTTLLMLMMLGGFGGGSGSNPLLLLLLLPMLTGSSGSNSLLGGLDMNKMVLWGLLPKMGTMATLLLGGVSGLMGQKMFKKTYRRRRSYSRRPIVYNRYYGRRRY